MTRALGVGILGAGGTIAPAVVRDLAESEEVGSLRLLDLQGARAEASFRLSLPQPVLERLRELSSASPDELAAAAVRLIARGRIDAVGVHPPEACVDPDDLFHELERRGMTFEVLERTAA